jgi:hypothetical protein
MLSMHAEEVQANMALLYDQTHISTHQKIQRRKLGRSRKRPSPRFPAAGGPAKKKRKRTQAVRPADTSSSETESDGASVADLNPTDQNDSNEGKVRIVAIKSRNAAAPFHLVLQLGNPDRQGRCHGQFFGKQPKADAFKATYKLAWEDEIDGKEVHHSIQPENARPFETTWRAEEILAERVELSKNTRKLNNISVKMITDALPSNPKMLLDQPKPKIQRKRDIGAVNQSDLESDEIPPGLAFGSLEQLQAAEQLELPKKRARQFVDYRN